MYKTDSIAILLATHNGEKFIKEQLESLLLQSYRNFKIFVSDDLSTDNTPFIIEEYCEKYSNRIVNIHNQKYFGNARDNFFNLLLLVEAPFYMFCDQDDVWHADKIKKTVLIYEKEVNKNQPILIHSDLEVVSENLSLISSSFMKYTKKEKKMNWKGYLVENNNVVGCTVGINQHLARLYQKNYIAIETKKIFMHDHFFALLAIITGKIIYIDEVLIKYRQHENNSVGVNIGGKPIKMIVDKIINVKKYRILQLKREENIQEILKCCSSLNNEIIRVYNKYSMLQQKNKISRIYFLVKNHLFRKSFIENLYLFIFI